MQTKKKCIKTIIIIVGLCMMYNYNTYADIDNTENTLHIIPQANEEEGKPSSEMVNFVGGEGKGADKGNVISRYNEKAEEISKEGDIGKAFKTGIMDWNILPNYAIYLMKFLSQVGILIGGLMVLYAGYLFAVNVFYAQGVQEGNKAIKNAIIGILVIIFSYAILAGLQAMFL